MASMSESESTINENLIEMVHKQIKSRGIKDPLVLKAMATVPRQKFVTEDNIDSAYQDEPLSIGFEQTISQPYMVALMTEKLELNSKLKVLEIGTGSGYQTAVLADIAKEVYTIERLSPLQEKAKLILKELGYNNIHFKIGDGSEGWKEMAPFDRIIVTAGAAKIAQAFVQQLKDKGILIIPVGADKVKQLIRLRKDIHSDNHIDIEKLGACTFVPLIGKYA